MGLIENLRYSSASSFLIYMTLLSCFVTCQADSFSNVFLVGVLGFSKAPDSVLITMKLISIPVTPHFYTSMQN